MDFLVRKGALRISPTLELREFPMAESGGLVDASQFSHLWFPFVLLSAGNWNHICFSHTPLWENAGKPMPEHIPSRLALCFTLLIVSPDR